MSIFDENGDCDIMNKNGDRRICRLDPIAAPHESIHASFLPIELNAMKGFVCCPENSYKTSNRGILASYVTRGLEQDRFLAKKWIAVSAAEYCLSCVQEDSTTDKSAEL